MSEAFDRAVEALMQCANPQRSGYGGDGGPSYPEMVRTVLTAIREPTHGMQDVGKEMVWEFSPDWAPYAGIDADPLYDHPESAEGIAKTVWQAMIDEVLKDG